MSKSVQVCLVSDMAPGQARHFDAAGRPVVLVRIGDEFHAMRDVCSHEEFPLSEGEVLTEECEIECARHGSTFDLITGAPCSLPATEPVAVYEVKVTGEEVWVILP